jgi:hypothetical protein
MFATQIIEGDNIPANADFFIRIYNAPSIKEATHYCNSTLIKKYNNVVIQVDVPKLEYILKSETLDVLQVPAGYVSSIQALEEKSKLVVMSDYHLGDLNDEFRYPTDYFTIE